MNKQEWIDRAFARFVSRGVEPDDHTRSWAKLCYEAEIEVFGFELSPEESVDEELMAAAENQ